MTAYFQINIYEFGDITGTRGNGILANSGEEWELIIGDVQVKQ